MSGRADDILYPSIARSWGSSAKFYCEGPLCRKKYLTLRGRVHRHDQRCESCYEYELRQQCGLPPKES